MQKDTGTRRITLTITADVMPLLERWAAQDQSSLSAEVVRAARERAATVARAKAGA